MADRKNVTMYINIGWDETDTPSWDALYEAFKRVPKGSRGYLKIEARPDGGFGATARVRVAYDRPETDEEWKRRTRTANTFLENRVNYLQSELRKAEKELAEFT